MKREVVRMVAIVPLATLPLLPSTSQASAIGASNPPAYTSWYMNTVNTNTLYNMGCSRGTSDKNVSGTQHSTVIFDYGQPVYDTSKGYGASGFHQDTYFNTSEIAAAIEQYAAGYYLCTGSDISSKSSPGRSVNSSKR